MSEFSLPSGDVSVVSAVPVQEGDPEAHCLVRGTVEPAVDFELKLPLRGYHGRYLQYGCGGFCGGVESPVLKGCAAEDGGAAVAATDDGHRAPSLDGSWAANDRAARDDYFYRAPHVVAQAGKRLIERFYGDRPRHSYFTGCSNGGREALILAQRYPSDFDGIVAGAPTSHLGPLSIYTAWLVRTNSGPHALRPDQIPALHQAVLDACDGLDGLVDGSLEDPRDCRFDPADAGFSAGQSRLIRKLYRGPRDEQGRRLYPGGQPYGSESNWVPWLAAPPDFGPTVAERLADGLLKYTMYPIGSPASSVADVPFTAREVRRISVEGRKTHAMNLDLSRFRAAGGKLILWHGWADQGIPPTTTVDYYRRLGSPKAWARLFMVPSVGHCSGGDTLNTFDAYPAVVDWVERGDAPRVVIAERRSPTGAVERTRPVFQYPYRARYDGTGDVDDAANFRPVSPGVDHRDRIDWVGEYLHRIPGPSVP
ncbi:tannase/feruloyl esterase family alpha/beta hydrolase [Streptomyces marispadix]|uniref:Tannase/feruloyl esterase family alpha/beta hydrolase n=1 Tax=Streptomyces marispadix TaxID=2922868 RepID=A0ABS9T5N3_9ACTN|nr:tannase/feruloyl esterase family alpha/beta hydrolase [Streptomyces marispadix]MCH6163832.1 tannase/feruloyl esterase family alpha/beta hydrolase [Streptomyces marispadix]